MLMKVRELNTPSWLSPFTFLTECTAEKFCNTTGVYRHLANWSNSYVNFEMEENVSVEIKIRSLWGDQITKGDII